MNSSDLMKSEKPKTFPISQTPTRNKNSSFSPFEIKSTLNKTQRGRLFFQKSPKASQKPSINFKQIARNFEFPVFISKHSIPKPVLPSSFSISPSKLSTKKTLKKNSPIITKEFKFSINFKSQMRQSLKKTAKLRPLIRKYHEKANPVFLKINRLTALKKNERKYRDFFDFGKTEASRSKDDESENNESVDEDVISVSDYFKTSNFR
jgi:hypothetical protein